MNLPDVNILVHAHREEDPLHDAAAEWLSGQVGGTGTMAFTHTTLTGFIRVATLPFLHPPTPTSHAVEFIAQLLAQPNCVVLSPGPRYWEIFRRLLQEGNVRGNLVPDAHLAAIAIEHDATLATRDRDFARFPGLRWFDPIADQA